MTQADKLSMLEGITDETDISTLDTYLQIAADVILRHCYPFGTEETQPPEEYDVLQVQIAAYLLNKRGAEGETTHSENGINRHYEDGDIPPSLLRRIVPKAGLL